MSSIVDSLPDRPLEKPEVKALPDSRSWCINDDAEVAYAVSLFGSDRIFAIGLDPDQEVWVRITSADANNYSHDAAEEFFNDVSTWVYDHYGAEINAGDLEYTGPEDADYVESTGRDRTGYRVRCEDCELEEVFDPDYPPEHIVEVMGGVEEAKKEWSYSAESRRLVSQHEAETDHTVHRELIMLGSR